MQLGFIAALIGGALVSQTHAATAAAGADLVGQVAGYSADVANEEGYWYSRYSMMTLTMQSGLGTTIPMDAALMSMMQQMMTAVGATPDDPVMPPVNPRLLLTIHAGGDPHGPRRAQQRLRGVGADPRAGGQQRRGLRVPVHPRLPERLAFMR